MGMTDFISRPGIAHSGIRKMDALQNLTSEAQNAVTCPFLGLVWISKFVISSNEFFGP